jgi:hypothetical protein
VPCGKPSISPCIFCKVRLFPAQDLKLRDIARFDGWVVPPAVPPRDPASEIPPPPDIPYNLPIEEFVKIFPERELVPWWEEPRYMDPRIPENLDLVDGDYEPYPREDVSALSPSYLCRLVGAFLTCMHSSRGPLS